MALNVTVGNITFDNSAYDERGDVLYLSVGEPRAAADGDETPEGHALRFDEHCHIIGLTIINARWLIDRDGEVVVSLPEVQRINAKDLEQALTP